MDYRWVSPEAKWRAPLLWGGDTILVMDDFAKGSIFEWKIPFKSGKKYDAGLIILAVLIAYTHTPML